MVNKRVLAAKCSAIEHHLARVVDKRQIDKDIRRSIMRGAAGKSATRRTCSLPLPKALRLKGLPHLVNFMQAFQTKPEWLNV